MGNVELKVEKFLAAALEAENGRQAKVLVSDGPLRQTVIALRAGVSLQEHNSPPAASVLVLRGSITVTAQEETVVGEGDIVALTHHRHSVTANEDACFLLTTVTSQPGEGSHSG